MTWVDLDYYRNEYLLGRIPSIPDTDFLYLEQEAGTLINWRNIAKITPDEMLKNCVCEVAELIYSMQPQKVIYAGIYPIVSKHLSLTKWHNNFVSRGIG